MQHNSYIRFKNYKPIMAMLTASCVAELLFSVLKSYTRAHGILGFKTGKQFKNEKCLFVDQHLLETCLSMRYYTHLWDFSNLQALHAPDKCRGTAPETRLKMISETFSTF